MENETSFRKEEEYHFGEEIPQSGDVFNEANPTPVARGSFFDRIKRKNIVIAIVVIVGVVCLYKLIDVFMVTGHLGWLTKREAPVMREAPIVEAPAPVVSEAPPPPPVAVESPAEMQQNQAMQDSLSRLNDQMGQVQGAITNLSTQISTLGGAMQDMAKMMADQIARQQAKEQAEAAAKLAEQRAKAAALLRAKAMPRPVYYVKAMIPGRAWLITGTGETITVSVGNNLPGYGLVQSVDPAQGTVVTSAGAIIGYSAGDM